MICIFFYYTTLDIFLLCPGYTKAQLASILCRGQVFLCSLGFIKRQLEIQKVKSTADASKKIKTNHSEAFCKTH